MAMNQLVVNVPLRARMRLIAARTASVIVAVLFALGVSEIALHILAGGEAFSSARELRQFRNMPDGESVYTIDPEFGFRPKLGNAYYGTYGTQSNEYALAKKAGVIRLLFVGDSVTARGAFVNALKREYEGCNFEYWNAGVESFNTIQEVAFYKRYNAYIEPDHVILTFHLNDFETTPVAFLDDQSHLIVYAPNVPTRKLNLWLFKHCTLYRLLVGRFRVSDKAIDAIIKETSDSLEELRDLLAEKDIALTVLVLTWLKPHEEWNSAEKLAYAQSIAILQDLNIRHFDLFGIVEAAAKRGDEIRESPSDTWHPSHALARIIARELKASDLLTDTLPTQSSAGVTGAPQRGQ